jgi:hypothetical protein
MSEEIRQMTLAEYVAEKMMIHGGWDPNERETSLEWDLTREDSQYAINLDVAKVAIEATLEALPALETEEEEPFRLKGPQYASQVSGKVLSNSTYISLEKDQKDDKILVGDLRHMVDLLDHYGVPDDYEVQGNIAVCFENDPPFRTISRQHPSTLNKSEEDLRRIERKLSR